MAVENSSAHQVQEFATTLWDHPLVHSKVMDQSRIGKDLLGQYMGARGIQNNEYFGLPFGDIVSLPPGNFRHAYFVIHQVDRKLIPAVNTVGTPLLLSVGSLNRRDTLFVSSPLETPNGTGLNMTSLDLVVRTLLTPDDLIAGNTKLAQSVRREAMYFIEKRNAERFWDAADSFVHQQFDKQFRYALADHQNPQMSHLDEVRRKLAIPSFQTYQDAMHHFGGALPLLKVELPSEPSFVSPAVDALTSMGLLRRLRKLAGF